MLEKITLQTLKKAVFYSWIAAAVIQLAEVAVIFADQANEISHKPGRNMIASAVIVVFCVLVPGFFAVKNGKQRQSLFLYTGFFFKWLFPSYILTAQPA